MVISCGQHFLGTYFVPNRLAQMSPSLSPSILFETARRLTDPPGNAYLIVTDRCTSITRRTHCHSCPGVSTDGLSPRRQLAFLGEKWISSTFIHDEGAAEGDLYRRGQPLLAAKLSVGSPSNATATSFIV